MARKQQLRAQRAGTVINATSKQQESDIIKALGQVVRRLEQEFGGRIKLVHQRQWYLKDIVAELRRSFPGIDFHYHSDKSSIRSVSRGDR